MTIKSYTNSEAREAINEVVHNVRDRAILLGRYIDGKSIDELADEFFLSDTQIKRIIRKHRHAIFAYAKK